MRYAAFLRAINVGGRVVTMHRLRSIVEGLGLSNVETVIASGNVLFDSASRAPRALERRIAAALRVGLGYDVATFLRTAPELASVLPSSPFGPGAPGETLYIGFLAKAPPAAIVQRVRAAGTPTERLAIHGRELYWLLNGGYGRSMFGGPRLEKLLGAQTTVRKAETVRRMVARCGGDGVP